MEEYVETRHYKKYINYKLNEATSVRILMLVLLYVLLSESSKQPAVFLVWFFHREFFGRCCGGLWAVGIVVAAGPLPVLVHLGVGTRAHPLQESWNK